MRTLEGIDTLSIPPQEHSVIELEDMRTLEGIDTIPYCVCRQSVNVRRYENP